MFKNGLTNIHVEERSVRSSIVSDDVVQNVEQTICESGSYTISDVSSEFPQISHIRLYEIITG
jgi:hypothetical protein